MLSLTDVKSLVFIGPVLVMVATIFKFLKGKPKKPDALFDFDNQSIETDSKEHIRICASAKDKALTEFRFDDVRTLHDVLPKGQLISSNGPCLGTRPQPGKGAYNWINYSEVLDKVRHLGSGLYFKIGEARDENFNLTQLNHIGIYSSNRPEWIVSEHACYSFSYTVISLYDSYGKDAIKYMLNHAEIRAIFVDNHKRLMNILEVIDDLKYLKLIVHFDNFNDEELSVIKKLEKKIEIYSFDDLMPPKPSDIATVVYTSGTTGLPKGALISHGAIVSNEAAIYERLNQPHLNYSSDYPKVVHMGFLPLAHMMERQASIMTFLSGGAYGFISGEITGLLDDIQELKPTNVPMIPRILNRLYNQVISQLNGSKLKLYLLNKAISAKEADRKKLIYKKDSFYDKLIFNKIRAKLGGNVIRTATGSAPISNEVMNFSKAAFGCPIPEGYGQTEATCSITFSHPFDPSLGHCGPPISCFMVKLVTVEEMGYYAHENKGEICAKGPSLFKGYLKDEEKTAETLDKDGWLHTGDIGMWLENGTLKIIDRKKNLFKLSIGEYISPDKIENVYLRSQFISQIFIDGNSLKDYIVGIVVPEPVYLINACKKLNLNGELKELCENKEVKRIILKDLVTLGKDAGLMSYEQVKNIHLCWEPFTLEKELVTATLKNKRFALRNYFKDTVECLYKEGIYSL